MKRPSSFVVLELGASRLAALEVASGKKGLRLTRAIERTNKDGPIADAQEYGRWMRQTLDEGAIGARDAIVALDRGEVIVKHLRLEGAGIDRGDLPGMVRLQMLRQLTFHPDDAAIDFSIEDEREGDGSASFGVVAAALPGERIGWIREALACAKLRAVSIGLKTDGVAALMRTSSSWRGGRVLAIGFGKRGADFVLMDSGRVVYSRGVDAVGDAGEAGNDEAFASWVATEARRTWMTHAVQPDAEQIERAVVLGGGGGVLASMIADRCAEALGVRMEAAASFSGVDPGEVRTEAWMLPLAGLALGFARGENPVDLANPKRPPDRTARKRQLALAAVLAVILGFGWLFTQANLAKGRLEGELEALNQELSDIRKDEADALRRAARLEHLERWMAGDVSWVDHFAEIVGRSPGHERVLITTLAGGSSTDIEYERKSASGEYAEKKWSSATGVTINFAGRAVDRVTADALRGAFVSDPLYRVEPRGRDVEAPRDDRYVEQFAMILRSSVAAPAQDEEGGGE